MTHCCSQCNFTAQFETALLMHRQLHHDSQEDKVLDKKLAMDLNVETIRRSQRITAAESGIFKNKYNRDFKLPSRSSSATRLFDKLRARICKSKTLFSHTEEMSNAGFNDLAANDTSVDLASECTSKAAVVEPAPNLGIIALKMPPLKENKEIYSCHLCNFDADRITVLDRHLLNDHKLDLEHLLKLVIAKTREGVTDSTDMSSTGGNREPYYKAAIVGLEDGEFIIETVEPKVKILKNTSTNTDLQWKDIPNLTDNCQMITKELKKLMNNRTNESCDKEDFMEKMQALNEYMCKFVSSSNALKKTLTKEFGSRNSIRERLSVDQPFFDLSLEETRDSPREWERAHSEKLERNRIKYGSDNSRSDKKLVAESFYF